jgi:hypothetical protein
MKKIFLILVLAVSFSAGYSQPNNRLKEVRKQKFLEVVSVDDAIAERYFNLFDANFNARMNLSKQKKDNLEYVEKNNDAADVTAKLDEILEIDAKILEKKKELYAELKTFLTPKQLAQTIVFQAKFTKKLKEEIERKKKKREER